jgi:hypothetical protein
MTTPADFRQYALDCMREAESADDIAMQLAMVGLARVWMDVALEMDRHVMRASNDDVRDHPMRPKPTVH